jgi:uncharacterized protein (DUF1778 family)
LTCACIWRAIPARAERKPTAAAAHRSLAPRARKPERVSARLSPAQKERLLKAAALQHQSPSQFILSSARHAADKIVGEHEVMRLSEQDARLMLEVLDHPGPANPNLAHATERYKALFGDA